ncbi:MAG: solute-binding protein [Acidobacteria bacterium]|nr:solute-binding protein [Acidobacteriota bacterium]
MRLTAVVLGTAFLVAGAGIAPAAGRSPEILVLSGSASEPVLARAVPRIRRDLGITVLLDLGGSGSLLSQLELTHRGDIYLPGSQDFLERAIARRLVDPATRVDFAYLVPALLVRRGNPKHIGGLADLARPDVRAAIAEPRTVCVGLYAKQILRRAGVPPAVQARLGRARSCAATANYLALGSVDAIIGWRVFTAWFPGRLEIVPLPPGLITRVATIQGAVTTFTAHREAARRGRLPAWPRPDRVAPSRRSRHRPRDVGGPAPFEL